MSETGWICPVCGRGIAPWIDECDCIDIEDTEVKIDLDKYLEVLRGGPIEVEPFKVEPFKVEPFKVEPFKVEPIVWPQSFPIIWY